MKLYLADVFEKAKEHLWAGTTRTCPKDRYAYTCHAIELAIEDLEFENSLFHGVTILEYVASAGVNTDSLGEFVEFPAGDGNAVSASSRQGARFLWLCMLEAMARDEQSYLDTDTDLIEYGAKEQP